MRLRARVRASRSAAISRAIRNSGRDSSRCRRASDDAPRPRTNSLMRIAVLIPAYQAAAHLGEVLLRLQAQPERHEALVVDDGSRDATAEVARQHGARVLS